MSYYKGNQVQPPVPNDWTDPATQPDMNIRRRGWTLTTGRKFVLPDVVTPAEADPQAPQLKYLFDPILAADPTIVDLYLVYGWKGRAEGTMPPPVEALGVDPAAHLIGIAVTPGQLIKTPKAGRDIGWSGLEDAHAHSHAALVLYADEEQVFLKYSRQDGVNPGYIINLIDFCVDPQLLALYRSVGGDRTAFPILTAEQPVGRATNKPLVIGIRDTGTFMDARMRGWWFGM